MARRVWWGTVITVAIGVLVLVAVPVVVYAALQNVLAFLIPPQAYLADFTRGLLTLFIVGTAVAIVTGVFASLAHVVRRLSL